MQPVAQARGAQHRNHILAAIRFQAVADDPEFGIRHLPHGGSQLAISLAGDETRDCQHHHPVGRRTERFAQPRARHGIGAEYRGIAAVADRHGVAGDVQAAGVTGFLGRNSQEDVGRLAAGKLHAEAQSTLRPATFGVVEQEAMAGEGHAWHAGPARRQASEKAADRHVCVHHVRGFGAEQFD